MSVVLIVEQDSSYSQRIADVLEGEGLATETCEDPDAARRIVAESSLRLLIASASLPDVRSLLDKFSRARGGPGAIVLIPTTLVGRVSASDYHADELLAKPFTTQELKDVVSTFLPEVETLPDLAWPPRMSSVEIFGDVLQEVEDEAKRRSGPLGVPVPISGPLDAPASPPASPPPVSPPVAAPPPPASPPSAQAPASPPAAPASPPSAQAEAPPAALTPPPAAASPPPAAAPPPPAAASAASPAAAPRRKEADDIDRKLEETLSGVIPLVAPKKDPEKPPAKKAPPKDDTATSEIDKLLDKTLSSLELPIRKKPRPASPQEDPAPSPGAHPSALATVKLPRITASPAAPPAPEAGPGPEPLATEDVPFDDLPDLPDLDVPELDEPPPPALEAVPEPEAPIEFFPGSVSFEADPEPVEDAGLEPPPAAEPPSAEPPSPAADEGEAIEFFPGTASFEAEPDSPDAGELYDLVPDDEGEEEEAPIEFFPGSADREEEPGPEPAGDDEVIEFFPSTKAGFLDLPVTGPPVPEGEAFGDYTLLRRIAVGGMAEVWQARRRGVEGFQKTVAIKKILSHLTHSEDFVTMFIDEAKLAAQLNHNNIIQIYDLGKVGEDFFIAMEYVDGLDLRTLLNKARRTSRPLPTGLSLLIASCLARALDYAHRKRDFDNRALGLVHRDVSPQNVLISYEGEIKLCDFGIVKAVAKTSQTQMGALKGKLQYMSPEQAWGRNVDARSDIFSLGAVLFELLTDTRLFAGESELGVLDAVRECRTRTPRDVVPGIPREVDQIVRRALAKTPEERYQTAGEMEEELKTVLFNLKPMPSQSELATYMSILAAAPDVDVAAAPAKPRADEAPTPVPAAAEPAPVPAATEPTPVPAAAEPTPVPAAAEPTPVPAAPEPESPVPTFFGPSEPVDETPTFFPEPSAEISRVAAAVAAPAPAAAKGGGGLGKKVLVAFFLLAVLAVVVYFALDVLRPAGEASPAAVGTPPPPAPAAEAPPAPESAAPEEGAEPAGGDPASGEETEVTPAGEDGAPAQGETAEGGLDVQELIDRELEKRAEATRQEVEQEFEEKKKRLEAEIAAQKAAASQEKPKDPKEEGGGGGGP